LLALNSPISQSESTAVHHDTSPGHEWLGVEPRCKCSLAFFALFASSGP